MFSPVKTGVPTQRNRGVSGRSNKCDIPYPLPITFSPDHYGGTLRVRPTYPRGATFLHLHRPTLTRDIDRRVISAQRARHEMRLESQKLSHTRWYTTKIQTIIRDKVRIDVNPFAASLFLYLANMSKCFFKRVCTYLTMLDYYNPDRKSVV